MIQAAAEALEYFYQIGVGVDGHLLYDSLDTFLHFARFLRVCVGWCVGHVVAAIAEWSHVPINWWNIGGVGVRGKGYHEEGRILLQGFARGKPDGLRTMVRFVSF